MLKDALVFWVFFVRKKIYFYKKKHKQKKLFSFKIFLKKRSQRQQEIVFTEQPCEKRLSFNSWLDYIFFAKAFYIGLGEAKPSPSELRTLRRGAGAAAALGAPMPVQITILQISRAERGAFATLFFWLFF